MKRYLLVCDFCFDLVVLSLLLLSLGPADGKKVAEDMPIETVPGANLEEAVDVEVTKIMKEK
jgi:hypothetical protein